MRILVIGASGFIGHRAALQLATAGHEVVPCGRDAERLALLFPGSSPVQCDFAEDGAADWRERLRGFDAVLNAAGIFEEAGGNSFEAVHIAGPKALFEACAAARIGKLIHVSALGTDEWAETPFHLTKRTADDYCALLAEKNGFDGWVVVRPSLVVGRGGKSTALFSALAALPLQLDVGGGSKIQPIHIADLCEAIRRIFEHDGPLPRRLDLVGPSPMTTGGLTAALRQWLGLSPAPRVAIPASVLQLSLPLARIFSGGTISADSLKMLKRGNTASDSATAEALSWRARPLEDALAAEPASQADLWQARLFFLRPALRLGLAFIWIATALVSAFLYPIEKSAEMVAGLGISGAAAGALIYAASAWDGILGLALLFNIRPAFIGLLQIATVIVFTVLATFAVPSAWIEPFGPLTKNVAVVLATLAMIAFEARR